ncbi:Uncharacterised protein [Klebsiella pneumoniae]|nr:Uncharacterised protein [Klebsiella pneumoniae]
MNKYTSIYLDFLRFFSALLVLLYHSERIYKIEIPYLGSLGKEAVAVFLFFPVMSFHMLQT